MLRIRVILFLLLNLTLNAQNKKISTGRIYTFKVQFANKDAGQRDAFKKYFFEIPVKQIDTTKLKEDWFFIDAEITDSIKNIVKLTFTDLFKEIKYTITAHFMDLPAAYGPDGARSSAFKTNGTFVIRQLPAPRLKWGDYYDGTTVPLKKFKLCDSLSVEWSYKGRKIPCKLSGFEMVFNQGGSLRVCYTAGAKVQVSCYDWLSKMQIPSLQNKVSIYISDVHVQWMENEKYIINGFKITLNDK